MTGSCISIENESSGLPGADANFKADKSLTTTGQKMVSKLTTTGQKLEMHCKTLSERNLLDVINNRKTSWTKDAR